jgi:hypothetical protein
MKAILGKDVGLWNGLEISKDSTAKAGDRGQAMTEPKFLSVLGTSGKIGAGPSTGSAESDFAPGYQVRYRIIGYDN